MKTPEQLAGLTYPIQKSMSDADKKRLYSLRHAFVSGYYDCQKQQDKKAKGGPVKSSTKKSK